MQFPTGRLGSSCGSARSRLRVGEGSRSGSEEEAVGVQTESVDVMGAQSNDGRKRQLARKAATMGNLGVSTVSTAAHSGLGKLIDFFVVIDIAKREVVQRFPRVGSVIEFPFSLLLKFVLNLYGSNLNRNRVSSFVIPEPSGALCYCSTAKVKNQVLAAVSRCPATQFMERALKELISLCAKDLAPYVVLEPFVRSLISEIPIPPVDRTMRVVWERGTIFKRRVPICTPRMKHLPLLDDRGVMMLLSIFTMEDVLEMVEHLLSEDSVVLYGPDVSRFVPIAETLRALIFPFVWQGLFIPFLPETSWHVLQSSSPLLVGVRCTSSNDFKLRLHSNSQYQKQAARRYLLINVEDGALETVCRAPGLMRRLASSFANFRFVEDQEDFCTTDDAGNELTYLDVEYETSVPSPALRFPEPIRSNILSQANMILLGFQASKTIPQGQEEGAQSTNTSRSHPSTSTYTSSGSSSSKEQSVSGSTESATSFDSVEEESSDERVWIDQIRIVMLEAFLSMFSHLKFHVVAGVGPFADDDDGGNSVVSAPVRLSRTQSCSSNSSVGSLSSRTSRKRAVFYPEAFLSDLPEQFYSFVEPFLQTRLFCDLISRQTTTKTSTLFDRLAGTWRKHGATKFKRKMSPIMKKLQDLLIELGYSMASTRIAMERLSVLTPEEMNKLFTSMTMVRETLDHMDIPRYVICEDAIAVSASNPRTRKLRELMERSKVRDKPPLVSLISLDKYHKDETASWDFQPERIGEIPILREELVMMHTVASLPPEPPMLGSGEERSAKLSLLSVISASESSGVAEDSTVGDMVRHLSCNSISSLLGLTEMTDVSSYDSSLQWSEMHAQRAADDTTSTLLTLLAATESERRSQDQRHTKLISGLHRDLSEKEKQIRKLQKELEAKNKAPQKLTLRVPIHVDENCKLNQSRRYRPRRNSPLYRDRSRTQTD